jgi:hypothetical protein
MSTFGKKAINNWDYKYSEENAKRFNRTPIELQLEILEKWYPIGMNCIKYNKFFNKYDKKINEIIGYDKIGVGTIYQLKLIRNLSVNGKIYNEELTIHPIYFKPTDEWTKKINRDKKLNDLLG